MGCCFFSQGSLLYPTLSLSPIQNQNKNKTEVIVLPTDDVYLNFKNGAE